MVLKGQEKNILYASVSGAAVLGLFCVRVYVMRNRRKKNKRSQRGMGKYSSSEWAGIFCIGWYFFINLNRAILTKTTSCYANGETSFRVFVAQKICSYGTNYFFMYQRILETREARINSILRLVLVGGFVLLPIFGIISGIWFVKIENTNDNLCYAVLSSFVAVIVLGIDLLMSIIDSYLFVGPLLKLQNLTAHEKRIAVSNLIASLLYTTSTFAFVSCSGVYAKKANLPPQDMFGSAVDNFINALCITLAFDDFMGIKGLFEQVFRTKEHPQGNSNQKCSPNLYKIEVLSKQKVFCSTSATGTPSLNPVHRI